MQDKNYLKEKQTICGFGESICRISPLAQASPKQSKNSMNPVGKTLKAGRMLFYGAGAVDSSLARSPVSTVAADISKLRTVPFPLNGVVSVAFSLWFVVFAANANERTTPPPFIVKGSLHRQTFIPGQSTPRSETRANVTFQFSNDWWQVDIVYIEPKDNMPVRQNCMRVPGGIRHYSIFKESQKGVIPVAEVCPMPFPPPGNTILFVPWLALCPNAEILEKDGKVRFLSVPSCAPSAFAQKASRGDFGIEYFDNTRLFFSNLTVTNNGVDVSPEGEAFSYAFPFDQGFRELEYSVIESTNINGLVMPLRAVFRRFGPRPGAQARMDIAPSVIAEFTVNNISFSAVLAETESRPPPVLLALDARPANLAKGRTADYLTTNDQWKASNSPEIELLAKTTHSRGMQSNAQSPNAQSPKVSRIIVVVTMLMVPFVYFLVRSLNRRNEQQ